MAAVSTQSTTLSGGDAADVCVKQGLMPEQKLPEQPVASRTRRLSSASSQRLFVVNDDAAMTTTATTTKAHATRSCDVTASRVANKEPSLKKLAEVLAKESTDRSPEEAQMLVTFGYLTQAAEDYQRAKQEKKLLKQRLVEVEESLESIQAKTDSLANLIKESRHVVIYTGAGISTSASIPDYRGPNGLWTQIKKTGTFSLTKVLDLSNAEPTYTHMAIKELCRRRIVKHVVSQNCDGLHLRSGIAQSNLSEIHGNMYIEVCQTCERQYFRDADVTQQTSRFRHKTGRACHSCSEPNNNLVDTIVLYGERSRSKWPMNWERASKAADNADLIICMGSSLKTLRRYACLWPKSSSSKKSKSFGGAKLAIINLQHTSKDKNAVLKINGKCDFVMQQLMQRLNIDVPQYQWTSDPLLKIAVPFKPEERATLKRNSIFDLKKHNQVSECSTSPMQSYATATSPISSSASVSASSEEDEEEDYNDADAGGDASSLSRKRSLPYDDDNRDSPSLFVSELTDDPDKKRLRMRIRAVNVGARDSSKSPDVMDDDIKQITTALVNDCEARTNEGRPAEEKADLTAAIVVKENKNMDRDTVELRHNLENLSQSDAGKMNYPKQLLDYAPPGWLGKSLGHSKSNSYRRKRHGNKGRKRTLAQPTA